MPLQNRVRPDGSIAAVAERGTMMGNRGGAFHTEAQTLLPRHWRSKQWICCVIAFKDRHRRVMQPRRYTELFFLDEATALAAGHRPCFECRRAAADDFARRWNVVRGLPGRAAAGDMDRILHAERLDEAGAKRCHAVQFDLLPDHAFIRLDDDIYRIAGELLQHWTFAGYGEMRPRPRGIAAAVLTPPAILGVLGAGYVPVLHKSAAT